MNAPTGFAIGLLSVIELTGKDRNKIFNNLCTQDLRSLAHGQVKETFMLDVKGRTISHGVVACLDSKTIFVSSPGQAPRLVPHIDRYIIREDATVVDVSSRYQALLFEPGANDIQSWRQEFLSDVHCVEVPTGESFAVFMSVSWLGAGSTLVLVPAEDPSQRLKQLASNCFKSDCHQRVGWELRRIESFWPWFGVEIQEKNLPQEIGIDARAISFNKGCYLGQETVARLDALGQVQKQLVLVELQTEQDWVHHCPRELFLDGKSIGFLHSAHRLADKDDCAKTRWIGLAMLKRGFFTPQDSWTLDDGEILTACNSR
jgi:folate-binding protein YgfZ